MQWGCNAWSYDIRFTKPNPYISQKNSKTQKKNFKTPNLKSKCMKCMKERAFWSLTKWILLGMGCETLWRRDLSERRKYELREKWDLLRVRREKWKRNRTSTLNRKRSLMDRGSYREFFELQISTKMNLSRCYRGSIDDKKSVLMDLESVENLLSRQRTQKFVSMDQRRCRDCVE